MFLCKQNFTLIELLAVIAMIAVLTSMLLPALNAARSRGRETACLNHLKQIGTAYLCYSSEWGFTVKIWNPSGKRWMNILSGQLGGMIPVCPADLREPAENRPSYGITCVIPAGFVSGKEENPWYHVAESRIRKPSCFITVSGVSDSYFFGDGSNASPQFGTSGGELSVISGFCKNLSFRHDAAGKRFPAALADGHVERFSFSGLPDRYWDLRHEGGYGGGK